MRTSAIEATLASRSAACLNVFVRSFPNSKRLEVLGSESRPAFWLHPADTISSPTSRGVLLNQQANL